MGNILLNQELFDVLDIHDIHFSKHEHLGRWRYSPLNHALDIQEKSTSISLIYMEPTIIHPRDEHPADRVYPNTVLLDREDAIQFAGNGLHERQIYTDASKSPDSNVGYAAIMDIHGRTISLGGGTISDDEPIFRGELLAINHALAWIKRRRNITNTSICTDSRAAILAINGRIDNHPEITTIRKNLNKINKTRTCNIVWIPGHSGIPGNEAADRLAKEYSLQPFNFSNPSKSTLKRKTNDYTINQWKTELQSHEPVRKLLQRTPIELSLKPKLLTFNLTNYQRFSLFQALSGHFACNYFLFKIRKVDSENCNSCNVVETVNHVIFECKKQDSERKQLFDASNVTPPYNLPQILENESKTRAISRILVTHKDLKANELNTHTLQLLTPSNSQDVTPL